MRGVRDELYYLYCTPHVCSPAFNGKCENEARLVNGSADGAGQVTGKGCFHICALVQTTSWMVLLYTLYYYRELQSTHPGRRSLSACSIYAFVILKDKDIRAVEHAVGNYRTNEDSMYRRQHVPA